MASPIPKPAAQRQRRNRASVAASIEAPQARKVALPERETPWHALTVQTWDVWWASPISDEWVDADVPGLIETAQLVDDFWHAKNSAERSKLRAEIRLSSREYGLSSFSRRQLQWEVKRVEGARPPASQSPSKRRGNVLAVLQGGA